MTFGSGDSDAFNYDPNTGRMTQYQFNVGSPVRSVVGSLIWNANGTLNQLAITDPFNSLDQQTCTYAYDDLARVGNVNCLNPQSQPIWTQAFTTPDAFGNVQKTGSNGGTSWLPTYSEATNHYSSIPGVTGPYHDSNGNVIKDGFHSYTWDAEGLPHSFDSLVFTYDALGRAVEDSGGTQLVYSPLGGRLGFMSGQTYQTGRVPLVAGAWARYLPSGLTEYRHSDWLGSVRLSSTPSQGPPYYDGAYAPYGESYAEMGTTDRQFTGKREDTVGDLYDFPFREYHSTQGRWLSPDPAGLAAADLANPQSLNRYAYVMNSPTTLVDPTGSHFILPCMVEAGQAPGCNWNEPPGGVASGIQLNYGPLGDPLAQAYANYVDQVTPLLEFTGCLYGQCYGPGEKTFSSWDEYSDWRTDIAALPQNKPGYLDALNNQLSAAIAALEAKGATDQEIHDLIWKNSNDLNDKGYIPLEGGNFMFSGTNLFPGIASSAGCIGGRCDVAGIGTLDFGTFGHPPDTFHLDTGNPYNFPGGTLLHGFVDVFLGNFWYTFIPRPWPGG